MAISAEWEKLTKVMIHRPGLEIEYAMLSPRSFLFERPFNTARARKEHDGLAETLRSEGVDVMHLRDTYIKLADSRKSFRRALEEKVIDNVMFFGEVTDVAKARKEFARNASDLDSSTLFEILTLEPSLDLRKSTDGGISYPTVYSNIPLANLYFMRDQQAVMPAGMVIGNMKSPQRKKEIEITSFLFEKGLNLEGIFAINGEGTLEGGDFIPAGDYALFGTGNRTNISGVMQAMNSGLLQFDTIYAVENPVYKFMEPSPDPMVNMHLDTYINFPSSSAVVTSAELCRNAVVQVFHRNGDLYERAGSEKLIDVIRERDLNIIDLSVAEQLSYASNFLTLRDGRILAIDTGKVISRLLERDAFRGKTLDAVKDAYNRSGGKNMFPSGKDLREHGIDQVTLDLQELTGGYGGAHCMTASIERI
ncbi:MAG: arginine deiminase family protein [Candidatus Thermoplasmatota archaeon]|jgi:arginine deiminase|nr:arginine deiminase family protein [Candidatus Thermoplasmatota archaeon]MCL5800910.1 arginine deiminase family protein [Candidatus Thermoplasmatota archaeon]